MLLPSFSFPGELADVMARHQITDALLPTAVLRLLASGFVDLSKHDLRSLKTLWYGGEACPVSVLRRVKEGIPQVRLIHGYGPTETTHTACAMAFDAIPDDAPPVMPIGCPLPGVSAVVIDEHGRRAPTGVVGELYLGGVQVMAGYCGDEARTKSVIVDLPPEVGAPGRHYRTGDFVRVDEGGVFTFVERRDDLVKSRGHLVSLVEVERALLNDVRVSEAYVLATKAPDGSTLLHAVVVLQPSPSRAGAAALASELLKVIPAYAVPHAFSFAQAEEIPSTPQGKTDRRALAERFAGDHAARPGVRAESQRSPSTESRQDA